MTLPKRRKRGRPRKIVNNPKGNPQNLQPKGETVTEVIKEEKDPAKWIGRRKTKKDEKMQTYKQRSSTTMYSTKDNTISVRKFHIPANKRPDSEDPFYIYSWDKLVDCRDTCRIWDMCDLKEKAQSAEEPKCIVMKEYLGVALNVMLKYNEKVMNEGLSYRIGVHLIPLYRQLFRLKILELSVQDIIVHTKQGIKIHPVFKEMRETIRAIEMFWKEEKLRGPMFPDDSGMKPKKGDPDYHDGLLEGEEGPKRVVRIPKRKEAMNE